MLQVSDLSVVAYGGLVTAAERLDRDRIAKGKLANDAVLKKYGTYAYLVPGLVATVSTAFDLMPRWRGVNEKLTHGFLYDLPRFAMNMVDTLGLVNDKSAAVQAAQAIAAGVRNKPNWRPGGIVA